MCKGNHYRLSQFKTARWLGYLLFFVFLFLPFLWQWNNTTMISPEAYLPLDPGRELGLNLHVWYEQGRTGYPWLLYTALPYTAILTIFQNVGHSLALTQRLLFGLLIAMAGTSTYWLVINLLEHKRYAWFGAMGAALFYVFNPFFVYTFHWISAYTLALALLPLAMALYLWALQKNQKKIGLQLLPPALILAFASPVSQNIAIYLIMMSIFITFVIWFYWVHGQFSLKRCLAIIVMLGILLVALNLWWLLPLWSQFGDSYGSTVLYKESVEGSLFSFPMSESFRLILYYWLDKFFWGDPNSPYYAYASVYLGLFGTIVLSVVSFLAFSVLALKKKPQMAWYFATLSLIGIVLGQGSYSFMGDIYRWTLVNVRGFVAFRASDTKFPLYTAIGYAVLLGFSLTEVTVVLDRVFIKIGFGHRRMIIGWKILIVASLLILGIPVLSGVLVRPAVGQFPGDRMHSIPDYWKTATNWLDSQPGSDRVLSMPRNGALPDSYTWGYYGPPLLENISRRPNIQASSAMMVGYSVQEKVYYNIAMSLYDSLDQGQIERFRTMLDILNIGYIVSRKDLDPIMNWGGTIPITTTRALSQLRDVPGLRHVQTFGDLQIFKVDNAAPRIYASIVNKAGANRYCIVSRIEDIDSKACQLFLLPYAQDANEKPGGFASDSRLINISFQMVNPTRFNVQVEANESFWLVFSETFQSGWKAYVVEGRDNHPWYEWSALSRLFQERNQRTDLTGHYIVNNYANGWYVPKSGKYTIILEYMPQRMFEAGSIVSIFTFAVCIAYLLMNWVGTWRK